MITLKFFLENYLIEITYIFQIHYQDRTDNFKSQGWNQNHGRVIKNRSNSKASEEN